MPLLYAGLWHFALLTGPSPQGRLLTFAHGPVVPVAGSTYMSGEGECWDDAAVESFSRTIKSKLGAFWGSRAAARDAIFDYIQTCYNRKPLHSTLGYVSPETCASLQPIAA